MHRSRMAGAFWSALAITAALMLNGCGISRPDHAVGSFPPPPSPPPATPSPPMPKPRPPTRPFEIGLHNIDPCRVLHADQRAQLGFDRDPLPDSEGGFGNAPTCSYRSTTAKVGARLSLITSEGMGVWTDDTAQVEATPVTIAGFPGLVIKTPKLDLSCNVAVDVAGGQHLDVLYRDDGAQPPAPLDQLCTGAQRVATQAVRSLAHPESVTSTAPSESPEGSDSPDSSISRYPDSSPAESRQRDSGNSARPDR